MRLPRDARAWGDIRHGRVVFCTVVTPKGADFASGQSQPHAFRPKTFTETSMHLVRPILVALLLLMSGATFMCAASSGTAEPVTAEQARTTLRDAVRRLDLQTELPTEKEKNIYPENRAVDPPDINLSAEAARIVLWVAAIITVVIILMTLRDNLWSSSRRRPLSENPEEAAPEAVAARMDKAQDDADALADRGGFAEAMHLLLLQSVGELRLRLGIAIAASLTSREILLRVGLAPEGRAAFADIIGRVEISYFGPHLPGKEEYLACRRSFEALTESLRRESAA